MSPSYMSHLWHGGADEADDERGPHLKIDPIAKEDVARVRLANLKGTKMIFLMIALAVLMQPDIQHLIWTTKRHATRVLPTGDEWEERVDEMASPECGMLRPATKKEFKAWAKFFLVVKKDLQGRAIFNCRQANATSVEPPSVNLPDIGALLKRIDDITRGKGLFAFEMDLRHWFYQIPIIPELAAHFGVYCAKKFWALVSCPMGYLFSPFLAQSVSWGMLLKDAPAYLGIRTPTNDACPPAWVELEVDGVVVGLVTIWYDNIVVISSNKHMRDNWTRWIMGRAWEKDGSIGGRMELYNCKVKVARNTQTPQFLGLDFEFDEASQRTRWRHVVGAGEKIRPLHERCTKRQLSSSIGFTMWDNLVRLRDMCHVGWALELLSKHTAGVQKRADWDTEAGLPQADAARLNKAKDACVPPRTTTEDDEWFTAPDIPRQRVVVASDASSKTLAWVEMGLLLAQCGAPTIIPARVVGHRNIFLKELEAACLAVEGVAGRGGIPIEVVLLVDNAAAVQAIRKGWSRVEGATEFLNRIWRAVGKNGDHLTTLRVPGRDNVADSPTRGAALDATRLMATWKIVTDHDAGRGGAVALRTPGGERRLRPLVDFVERQGAAKRGRDVPPVVYEGESDEEVTDDERSDDDQEDN